MIRWYHTYLKHDFTLGLIPSLNITCNPYTKSIWIHWLFWGIIIEF